MSIHVDLEITKDGSIKSTYSDGCSHCSRGEIVTIDNAIREIEDAITELNRELELLNKLKEKSE